jgi:predicted ATPase
MAQKLYKEYLKPLRLDSVYIQNFHSLRSFNIHFGKQPISVFIGPNGLGKTSTISYISALFSLFYASNGTNQNGWDARQYFEAELGDALKFGFFNSFSIVSVSNKGEYIITSLVKAKEGWRFGLKRSKLLSDKVVALFEESIKNDRRLEDEKTIDGLCQTIEKTVQEKVNNKHEYFPTPHLFSAYKQTATRHPADSTPEGIQRLLTDPYSNYAIDPRLLVGDNAIKTESEKQQYLSYRLFLDCLQGPNPITGTVGCISKSNVLKNSNTSIFKNQEINKRLGTSSKLACNIPNGFVVNDEAIAELHKWISQQQKETSASDLSSSFLRLSKQARETLFTFSGFRKITPKNLVFVLKWTENAIKTQLSAEYMVIWKLFFYDNLFRLKKAFDQIASSQELTLEFSENQELIVEKPNYEFGTIIPFKPSQLSTGERRLLESLCDIFCTPGCIHLMDEPENSMHIEWQDKVVTTIAGLIQPETQDAIERGQIIITTHSPFIVENHTDLIAKIDIVKTRGGIHG